MHDFVAIECHICKTVFGMPRDFYNVAKAGAGKVEFFCPHGHGAVFLKGESETAKLRRERDRLKQEQAWYEQRLSETKDERDRAVRKTAAARGQITKLKKRAANGVCPCCNRTFADLAKHMAGQHPNFIAEPDATEHVH